MQPVQAETNPTPTLVISQFKITSSNGQSFLLYNAGTTSVDMSKYQLEYFNNYDLSKSTSSKLISLTGTVPSHGYYLVNDDSLLLCYQLTVSSVSLGLSSTAGMVELLSLNQSGAGGVVTPQLTDYVAWSKTAAAGVQVLPSDTSASLRRLPLDVQNNPDVASPGSGSWQAVKPDSKDACKLITVAAGNASPSIAVQSGLSQLLPPEPPATIVAVSDTVEQSTAATLPAADIGLLAPQVTELLPNPSGTGNDATDEYIELYNPNASPFDLSGFGLQAGTTVLHKYIFPAGASLPAQSFTAFYASSTGLSLSNSGGQAALLDPFGNAISSSEAYGTASDGQTWALAKGKWYWTTTPTPSAANVINQPVVKSKKKSINSKNTTSGKVKGASTKTRSGSSAPNTVATADTSDSAPVHFWTLALIGGLAILYGAYEYRADLGNYLYRLRRHFGARRANRP
jgi:hypothetical protein